MENSRATFIEEILASEVELARAGFSQVKWTVMDDAERTETRAGLLRALNRLSGFILQGIIPAEYQSELVAASLASTQKHPAKE